MSTVVCTTPVPRPPAPPTVAEIQQGIGECSSALFALHDMAIEINDQDTLAYRFGRLAGILAAQLDRLYIMLDEYVWDETHPADAPPQEEAPDTNA